MKRDAVRVLVASSLLGVSVGCDPEADPNVQRAHLEDAIDDDLIGEIDPEEFEPGTGDYVVQATGCQLENPADSSKVALNNGAWYFASGSGAVFLNCPITFNNASTIDSKTLWYRDASGAEIDNGFVSVQLMHRTPTGSGAVEDDQWDSGLSASTDYNRVTDGTNITIGDNAFYLRVHLFRTGSTTIIFTAVSFEFV
jgi:hypothetical protein